MDQIQIVGVLSDLEEMGVYRVICRRWLGDEERDYYIYVERNTAATINRLLDERPFKVLRLMPQEGTALLYAGDMLEQNAIPSSSGPRPTAILYLELWHNKSRRKYRLEVSPRVVNQFHWLLQLTQHDPKHSRPVLEA